MQRTIKFSDLDIGVSQIGKDDDEIKIEYERIDLGTVKVVCYAPNTDNIVMEAFIDIATGKTRVKNVDTSFWVIYLDGEELKSLPSYQKFDKLSTKVTAKKGKYTIELDSNG